MSMDGIQFPSEGVNFNPSFEGVEDVSGQEDFENPFVRTAEKTTQLGKQIASKSPITSRKVVQLAVQDDLTTRIRAIEDNWDAMEPESLAESIIDLEDRVTVLNKETSPELDKIRSQVKHLHFRYVFPIVSMLDLKGGESEMEIPFALQVYKLADQVLKTQSLTAFQELNPAQQWEVRRYAVRVQ